MGLTHLRGGEAKFFRISISYVVFGNYFTIFQYFFKERVKAEGVREEGVRGQEMVKIPSFSYIMSV